MFVLLGVAAILAFMPDAFSLPLLMIVIAITAYGVLAGGTALDDLIAMRDDMDEEMAATAYGTQVKARNLPGLKTLSGVLIGLIGLAEVLAIVF